MRKISRNSLCPCGSRLKYKKCCLKVHGDKTSIHQNSQLKKGRPSDGLAQKLGREVIFSGLPLNDEKMPDIVLTFAGKLLEYAGTEVTVHAAIDIACCAWNLSLYDTAEREKGLDMLSKELERKNFRANKEAMSVINELIQHKLIYYPHINRYIFDYTLSWSEKSFELDIVSSVGDVKEINFKKLTTMVP
jgi:hypothetical protein